MLNWRYISKLFALVSVMVPFVLWSGMACADNDACTQNGVTLPECNYVISPPIADTGGWALYCPPQEPYHWSGYWSATVNGGPSYDYTVSENLLAEAGDFAKGDYTIVAWLPPATSVTITSGCTPVNPNGGCTGNGSCQPVPTGPGTCTISNRNQVCIGGGESEQCWNEYSDTCVQGNTVNNWWCTDAEIFRTCCFGC
jgi:hypothetical protein